LPDGIRSCRSVVGGLIGAIEGDAIGQIAGGHIGGKSIAILQSGCKRRARRMARFREETDIRELAILATAKLLTKMRHGGSRRISPSCRTCYAKIKSAVPMRPNYNTAGRNVLRFAR
jgi:hypothetical protein